MLAFPHILIVFLILKPMLVFVFKFFFLTALNSYICSPSGSISVIVLSLILIALVFLHFSFCGDSSDIFLLCTCILLHFQSFGVLVYLFLIVEYFCIFSYSDSPCEIES